MKNHHGCFTKYGGLENVEISCFLCKNDTNYEPKVVDKCQFRLLNRFVHILARQSTHIILILVLKFDTPHPYSTELPRTFLTTIYLQSDLIVGCKKKMSTEVKNPSPKKTPMRKDQLDEEDREIIRLLELARIYYDGP